MAASANILERSDKLVAKLSHPLPEIRARAVGSLFSKVVLSRLLPVRSLPPEALASGLLRNLDEEKAGAGARLDPRVARQALRLALELAKGHDDGAKALCERCVRACVRRPSAPARVLLLRTPACLTLLNRSHLTFFEPIYPHHIAGLSTSWTVCLSCQCLRRATTSTPTRS
jgi:hypothetical protein